jgi:cytochrome b6-f complex subunit 5
MSVRLYTLKEKSKKFWTLLEGTLKTNFLFMVETLLSGIVLGLMPVTLAGLFTTAYLQYRRGDQLNL